jgi:amino acid permease
MPPHPPYMSHADAPSPAASFEEEKKDLADGTVLPTLGEGTTASEKERRRNEETQGGLKRELNSRQISMISIVRFPSSLLLSCLC